ncbi:bifunctional [glutamate--ammonia ligase]-adenylyl-L-tyrosine phosphorylase/[glutamate--ammonia-ligase] adenylyltransferase [uncultured Erythrobacter sp.]|uniref:bifunctional [glutamate--ammonia ligase]-adenylyl-L-tyrosine phosphorylase/[glutamate--ammonia-ligase] adenylyltransferase n=1 Tax=uncultured Erythrobacter sp. TaxID=263913 RepID=UPI00260A73A5|nr:bifunctional [glutamate--ammonia ligase]-adenylyl-L-tyrosine phosphorylase/[glutamate--ammonia-ligase] adenylyltransferase [uncultured Erythrobacter sp.]
MADPDWKEAIARARAHAPFLARALDRQPELEALLQAGEGEAALEWSKARGSGESADIALRRQRIGMAAALAVGDLAGAFPLTRVMGELTDFADHALDTAIRTAITERTGEERADGMIALGLGKQGAHELNYSSDIDPILLYDPASLPRRDKDDPGEAAQRYARRIVKLLSDTTAEGYVLRVDLRLRPAAEVSPLAVPRRSALSHYQGQALAWERAAFIRGRAAAGDIAAGEEFLGEIAPFIWRHTLDFGAVEEIRDLTLRIRQSYAGPPRPGPGFDIKRGRGGIREIEFFAQTHQLIHGGRDPSLRVRGTRAALDALAAAGRIEADNAQVLGEAYDRLRQIEHRLQMVNDRQTHSLPDGAALDNVAQLDGLADGAALVAELTALTEASGSIYEGLIGDKARAVPVAAPASDLAITLKKLSFAKSEALAARIEEWRDGRFAAIRSPQAVEAFDALLPSLLSAFAESDDPERAINRWQAMIERAPSMITVFRLLLAEPSLLERLVEALTLSPTLADQLARRPERLDVLLDQQPISGPTTVAEIAARMGQDLVRDDYEARLDAIRRETGEARFILGLRLIEAQRPPVAIARVLANLAEAAISVAAEATIAEFERKHGKVPGGELVILGLGRLGGQVLTHASDLDIIYLFTGEFSAQSDGEKPLGATLYFNRLASRITAALSVPTAQGALYEVDTRLRPQGNQGPLAVSLEAFAKYQQESAWTWEHMALTRARVLTGSEEARAETDAIIADVLQRQRDPVELRKAVLKMRGEMAQHKPSKGEIDVKLLRGGLVDIEFLTHFLQLRDAAQLNAADSDALNPDLGIAVAGLVAAGLLDPAMAAAHQLMTNMLVAGRLLAPDGKNPPKAAAKALARACGCDSYAQLMEDLANAREDVARCWTAIFDQVLETK